MLKLVHVIHESFVATISLNKCQVVWVDDHVILVLAKQCAFIGILPKSAWRTRDQKQTYLLRLVGICASKSLISTKLCTCSKPLTIVTLLTIVTSKDNPLSYSAIKQLTKLPWIVLTTLWFEPRHEKTCLREFAIRYDSNWPAHLMRLARVLKFRL